MGVLDHGQTANPGPHHDAAALGVVIGDGQAAVIQSLQASRNAVMDEDIHMTGFFGRNVLIDLKTLDLASKVHRHALVIKSGNGGDAVGAGYQSRPGIGDVVANG